jgi:hypothetical protein
MKNLGGDPNKISPLVCEQFINLLTIYCFLFLHVICINILENDLIDSKSKGLM